MLSRRDKLYIQPWEDRRYKDHRSKVRSALPAIDDRAPERRPHVAVKLKKLQREVERARKVQSDNRALLQRLRAVMAARRLDNRWPQPLPNFQQKVGLFYDAESLRRRLGRGGAPAAAASPGAKCYACDLNKRSYDYAASGPRPREDSLPSIF